MKGIGTGNPPTGRRFERVNEIYIFSVVNGRLADAIGVEDNLKRLRRLGLLAESAAGLITPVGSRLEPGRIHAWTPYPRTDLDCASQCTQ